MPKVGAYGATLPACRETSYGVAPLSGYRSLDFKSCDLAEQPVPGWLGPRSRAFALVVGGAPIKAGFDAAWTGDGVLRLRQEHPEQLEGERPTLGTYNTASTSVSAYLNVAKDGSTVAEWNREAPNAAGWQCAGLAQRQTLAAVTTSWKWRARAEVAGTTVNVADLAIAMLQLEATSTAEDDATWHSLGDECGEQYSPLSALGYSNHRVRATWKQPHAAEPLMLPLIRAIVSTITGALIAILRGGLGNLDRRISGFSA